MLIFVSFILDSLLLLYTYTPTMKSALFFLVLALVAPLTAAASKVPQQWVDNAASFLAGGVGGVCSVLVGHPFDLVKVRQQTASGKEKMNTKGTVATLGDIIATEGFAGMYRGVSAPIVAVAPIWAMSFWGFDTGDKLVRLFCKLSPDARLNILQLCIAGGFSALPTVLVMVPCERVKCLLQIQKQGGVPKKGTRTYKGFADCVSGIYKEAGLAGLYKGTTLTLMRDIPGNMVYFGVYTLAQRYFGTSPAAALVAGALAGVSFWPIVLPMDTLKSRYQTAPDGTYTNIGQVYSKLMQEEGVGGMFRGIGPAMIRSAPANAVSFLGAELTKSALAKFI